MGTDTHKVIHSVKHHISHQMKPYSSKIHLRVNLYSFLCICKIGTSQGNLAQLPQVIQSVKFHTSHQMKPYSRVRAIWGSSYTCFRIFGELEQVWEIGPKYPKSWTLIHRKSFIVINSTLHIKWSPTQV